MEQRDVIFDIERSDGRRFVLGTGTDWRIPNDAVEDWNSLEYSVATTPNVLTDGSRIVSERVSEKDRTLSAVYTGPDDMAQRAAAIAFFNPKHRFRVHVTYHGRTRWCEGAQYAFKPSTFNAYREPEITWTILCADPYMRDENGHDQAFGDEVPMFGFPYVDVMDDHSTPIEYPAGLIVAISVFDGKNTVYNNGDVPTGYTVSIKARALISNPSIVKDGRHIKVMTDLKAGDELLIALEGLQRVTINGVNSIQKTSRDSNFDGMAMQVGANRFSFECDNMENRSLADVKILFNDRYLGV